MGKKDIVTKDYLKDPVVFADAFNYLLYQGNDVIRPEQLKERDAVQISVPYGEDGAELPVQKYRDNLKCMTMMEDASRAYLMLGIESQSDVNYAMPVRNMLYDALQYAGQVEQTAASRKDGRKCRKGEIDCRQRDERVKPSSGEFLSGFHREDRLLPVITLVILFASKEWDGPVRLSDMFEPQDEGVMEFVSDFRINLMAPAAMCEEEINRLSSSLREVIMYIKHASDEAKLENLLKTNERFKNLDIKAARVINVLMNCGLELDEEREEVDMCKAIDDMRRHALEKGIEQGIEQGTLAGIVNLMTSMRWTSEQAMDALRIPVEKRASYGEKLQ